MIAFCRYGLLELDFVPCERPRDDAISMSDAIFDELWVGVNAEGKAYLTDDWRISYINVLASEFYFTAKQARYLILSLY